MESIWKQFSHPREPILGERGQVAVGLVGNSGKDAFLLSEHLLITLLPLFKNLEIQ